MLRNFLKSARGFGLVEVMVAAAMAGGLALVVAKISKDMSRVNKSAETNSEVNQFMSDVGYILSDRDNCNQTIPSGSAPDAQLNSIRRYSDTGVPITVYERSTDLANPIKYGNNTFSIKDMYLRKDAAGSFSVEITLTRESSYSYGARELVKTIPLEVIPDASGNVDQCFTNIDEIITSAVKQACGMEEGGTYAPGSNFARYDPALKTCIHNVETKICPPGQMITETGADAATRQITFTCTDVIFDPVNCFNVNGPGFYANAIRPDGTLECLPLKTQTECPEGSYSRGLDNGRPVCQAIPTCTARQFLRSNQTTGVLECHDIPCNAGDQIGPEQYFAGFNSAGAAVCKTFPNESCGTGEFIKAVAPDGTVTCALVPPELGIPKIDYSFVDGYDLSTHTWSRKTITQTAEQVCNRMSGFTWQYGTCRLIEQNCPSGYIMNGYYSGGYPKCVSKSFKTKTFIWSQYVEHKLDMMWVDAPVGSSCFISAGPEPWIQPSYWYYSGNQWTALYTHYSGFYIQAYHDPGGGRHVTVTCVSPNDY